eukprot:6331181-Prymnesium_polylepis.1
MEGKLLPTYTAIGASHTCGYPPITQFQLLRSVAFRALRNGGAVRRIQNSCISGPGPTYPACCLPYFVPKGTRYATIEFVASIRRNQAVHLLHMERMMHHLLEQSVGLVMLNIVPRETEMVEQSGYAAAAEQLAQLARTLDVPVVTFAHATNAS